MFRDTFPEVRATFCPGKFLEGSLPNPEICQSTDDGDEDVNMGLYQMFVNFVSLSCYQEPVCVS